MKKISLTTLILVVAFCGRINAQSRDDAHKETIEIVSWSLGATSNGQQTVAAPGNKGTLKFNKQGDKFSNVVFVDAAGKTHRLKSSSPGAVGGTRTPCKYPIPDACFATADKSIGMCMCKPTDLTANGDGKILVSLLLPAVQRVREAAGR
jgi:hypothetical protein